MTIGRIALISLGVYVVRLKRYILPNIDIVIPNFGLLNSNSNKNININNVIINAITIKFDNFSWILSFKPIDGIKIPYYVRLPFDVILSLPKLKSDIGKNIKIIPISKLGVVIEYRIIINDVSFYA